MNTQTQTATAETQTTILQIRNKKTMKSLNIKIGVEDIEKFKNFIGNSNFSYTHETIDPNDQNDFDLG